jgi:hypothetical protein
MADDIIIFDVDGILMKFANEGDIYGSIPDEMYLEMAREAQSCGLKVIVLTGRPITERALLKELTTIFEQAGFKPDGVIPYPGKFPGYENYLDWKLGWIEFFKPLAVLDDNPILAW